MKTYLVKMLIPCGLGFCVARATQYQAISPIDAKRKARADNVLCTIVSVKLLNSEGLKNGKQ